MNQSLQIFDEEEGREFIDDGLDSFQKALSGVTDFTELGYLEIMMTSPNVSDDFLCDRLSVSKTALRKLKTNPKLNGIVSKFIKSKMQFVQLKELESLSKVSSVLSEEFDYRVEEMRTQRVSYEDLFNQDYDHNQAKLIMSTRIEGMTVKDLINAQSVIAERMSKLKKPEEEDSGDIIETLSINYKKYRGKVAEVDIDDFSPDKFEGLTFDGDKSDE